MSSWLVLILMILLVHLIKFAITYLLVWALSICFGFSFNLLIVVAAYIIYLVVKDLLD